jgi:Protein of unknown function DUF262/Protein of unknown function (DUF1524)
MHASPESIFSYFNCGLRQYLVPLFQRPYTWQRPQWLALWEDLARFWETDSRSSAELHFMGAIVTTTARSVPVGVSKFLVIDGQQRLTTIAALLCAIRDQLVETDSVRRRIQEAYLTNASYSGLDFFKLLPTQDDRPAYSRLIEGLDVRGLDTPFIKAYEFFCKKLKKSRTDGGPPSPLDVLDVVERRLMVVMVNLGENDDPNLIFESLNFKGAPLNQADLIRNYFMMKFQASEQDAIFNRSWLPMQKGLGDSLTDFFRHYLGSQGHDIRRTDVYATVKALVKEEDAAAVRVRIERLAKLAEFYSRITALSPDPDAELGHCFSGFRRLDFGTVLPLLLKLYAQYDEGAFARQEFLECLRVLDSYIVRRAVVGVASNSLAGLFISLCRAVPGEGPSVWLREALASETKTRRWPEDDEFSREGLRRGIYPGAACQILLERLEEQVGHHERVSLASASIEHVLPQSLSPAWKEALGENWATVHQQWLHTLGNLTLTGYNSELGNREFGEKRRFFEESHFELNRYFVGHENWGANEIEQRGRTLVASALRLWPRPAREPSPALLSPKRSRAPKSKFHEESVRAAEKHLGVRFGRLKDNRYETGSGYRMVGKASMEYDEGEGDTSYWFGVSEDHRQFLYEVESSGFCFECGSTQQLLLIPSEIVRSVESEMSISQEHVLHLTLHKRGKRIWLRLLRGVDGPELTSFLVGTGDQRGANG